MGFYFDGAGKNFQFQALNARAVVRQYSAALCLILAVALAWILSERVISIPILPMADGKGYALRAFALYGYLHTGQGEKFWDLLTHPAQSIFALHEPLFLLLPPSLAGFPAYVITQYVTTFVVLAYAVFKVSKVLDRTEWAPGIFLLCAVNTIAWTDLYAFFLDLQFCALGLLVIALQMESWTGDRPRSNVLSGAALGMLFFLKPANALIFLATYAMSEAIAVLFDFQIDARTGRLYLKRPLLPRWSRQLLGFLPLVLVALQLGAAQTILQLIDQNEVGAPATTVHCTGLLRLLYFPLCFSACYHVLLLGGLILAAFLLGEWIPFLRQKEKPTPPPIRYLLPVALSYFVLGEFFSFGMLDKPLRSILLTLPIAWFLVHWIWEKLRLRWESLLFVAALYASCIYAQKDSAWFGPRTPIADSYYQLTLSSWTEMPAAWHHKWSLSTVICDQVIRDTPPGATICVNATEIRHDLAWRMQSGPFLRGESSPGEVRDLLDYQGKYYDHALVGANAVVLITFFPIQTSRAIWLRSVGAADYAQAAWCGGDPIAEARPLPSVQDEPVGTEFLLSHPLTQAEVDAISNSPVFADCPKATLPSIEYPIYGRHYSWAEAGHLLVAWYNKRLR